MESAKTRTNPFSISNILSNNTSTRENDGLKEQEKIPDSDREDEDLKPDIQKLENVAQRNSQETVLLTRTGFCSWNPNSEDRINSSSTRKLLFPLPKVLQY